MDVVTLIIDTIVKAFTTTVAGIGTGINEMFTSIMFTTDATTKAINGLSPLAGYTFALLGLSLVLNFIYRFVKR